MSTKTISLSEAAYKRLRAHRRGSGDSFSQVVMRARWEDTTVTAGELLESWKEKPSIFSEEDLCTLEAAKREKGLPADKWKTR